MLTKIAQWWLKKKQEQQKKKALSKMEKERIIVYQNYYNLLQFVKMMKKQVLVNRDLRKAFWSRVQHGEPLVEEYIKKAMEYYSPKKEESKLETKKEEQTNGNKNIESK